jgi:hypothetical protein
MLSVFSVSFFIGSNKKGTADWERCWAIEKGFLPNTAPLALPYCLTLI